MAKVGISYDEAHSLVGQQGSATDALRQHVTTVGAHVDELAGSNYVSATTQALMNKWHGEAKPKFEKLIARSEDAQSGTIRAVGVQRATQDDGAGSISAI